MSDVFSRLAAALPPRRAATAGDFATEAKALRTWIAALPLANFSAAAQQLADGLRAMNALQMAPTERLDALEAMREPALRLTDLLDKQIVGASFPLPPQRAGLGRIAENIQRQLALGYRICLHDLCAPSGDVPMFKGKVVAQAIVRALQHGASQLQKAYLLYRTPPQGAWQGLHDVYRFAVLGGLAERSVDDPLGGIATEARIVYTHALLLALTNPYHYGQREQLDMVALTSALARDCRLRDSDDAGRIGDYGPGYLPEERGGLAAAVPAPDLAALIAHVEGHLALLPANTDHVTFRRRGEAPVTISRALLMGLLENWQSESRRRHVRLVGGHRLDSVIGLYDLHYVLAGNTDFDGFIQALAGSGLVLGGREARATASWANGSDVSRVLHHPARVVDQGIGGYRLVWEPRPGEPVRARIGELVGLSIPNADGVLPDYMVGVIRWLRIDDEGRIDAGIELLSRRALPIGICRVDADGDLRAAMRGLRLRALRDGGGDMLLAPNLFERRAGEIELMLPVDPHRRDGEAGAHRLPLPPARELSSAYLLFALPSGLARGSEQTDRLEVAIAAGS